MCPVLMIQNSAITQHTQRHIGIAIRFDYFLFNFLSSAGYLSSLQIL